ncbi:non-structural maintenance of chromosomes element 1 [Marchantia polymorpha subsp. ruderalis]|uniref:Non-structural maintenance of chromosomes element 1 homolog n=2 Tax=Marchantia polymorpha TaxID=3197 RepID=A0AAF6BIX6_MARPO|nr:hypothetical protein MARPO_0185s0017 [Marchantia polymorpha]BBN11960.1 hypothetical protein Mp_5g16290 [Marchantia polymorpha subsp. ruderalis]|eukprot:PTQ27742.1 hypothetical protein MARPO_0185s0017 [Marchantia polymorpha]
MPMPTASTLNAKHHTFLQAIMNRGPLWEDTVLQIYKSLQNVDSLDGFYLFLGEINKELEFVEMELKKVTNQNDGKEYFGMINKYASPQAKLGSRLSSAQIAFFKAVMEAIVLEPSGEGYILSATALNLKPAEAHQVEASGAASSQTTAIIKMTMSAKEEALDLLVRDQWLSRTGDGGVSLGTRSFLELRGLFRNLEVPFCEVCNEAAIKAELCQNHECQVRMHSYCLNKKFRGRQARVCSRCHFEWVGAAAEDDDEEENMNGQTRNPRGSSRRDNTIREPMVADTIVVADTDDEEENITGHIRRPAINIRNSRRGSTLAKPAASQNERNKPARRSQYSTRNKSRVSGSPDNEENSEAEDPEEEDITRLDSEEEPEDSPPPRKRRLLRKRG